MTADAQHSGGDGAAIAPDTLVGGRFMVEKHHLDDALGTTMLARDQKTRKPIAIRILTAKLTGADGQFDTIRGEIKAAAKLKHRSLVGTYGVGTHAGTSHFIACEWIHGKTLAQLVADRKANDRQFSVRGVYNVVAHVCKALSKVHESTCHGALRPSVVWVTKSGRVKVGDFGVSLALVNAGKWEILQEQDQAFLAPEIKTGGKATAAADIFGVGALLYALMTGRSPIEDFIAPSAAHPDATTELDDILMKCLAADPAERYATAREISDALLPLIAESPEPEEGDTLGIDIEIDMDVAMSLPPESPARQSAPRDPLAAAPATAQLPSAVSSPGVAPAAAPKPRPPAGPDFGNLVQKLTENDAPRWMASKDGLDHGPFTARELIALIVDGEVLEEHHLLNMNTNERKPLGEYKEFSEFVGQYKIRKSEADHANALEKSVKVEKRSNVAKGTILTLSVAAVLLGGIGYLVSRQAAEQKEARADVDLAAMFESGKVQIKGTAGILKYKRRKGGGKGATGAKGSPGGGSPSAGGFGSYDDAMNTAMEMNLDKAGGEKQLSSNDVAGVMNRRLNSLFGCVGQELRKGGGLGTVTIDLAIAGTGKVMGASVRPGSKAFQSCIKGKVKAIKFPSFPAPRMGARYSFGVD